MAISEEFAEAVDNRKIRYIRILLKNNLIIDPTAAAFDEMVGYAESKLDRLYDDHDGEALDYNKANWDENYLNVQMVNLVDNFSLERVELLKSMVKYIYPDKVKKASDTSSASEHAQTQGTGRKRTGKGIAVVIAIVGAIIAIVGLCSSRNLLTTIGAVTLGAGFALILTNKE